jgi:XTP/dITP diphosphohydrolase
MELVFATNNQHKIEEIRAVIPPPFAIITLQQAGIAIEIPEPHETLEANAAEKARTIYKLTGRSCFSEDTGLEVRALNGAPGVRSARYAGEGKDPQKNTQKLLDELRGRTDRSARFRTVICLIMNGKEYFFEGICAGHITPEPRGTKGFGYDPVFVPDGADRTFAEMNVQEKSRFSHRKKALDKLVAFLNNPKVTSKC